jgi:hypothetical protein
VFSELLQIRPLGRGVFADRKIIGRKAVRKRLSSKAPKLRQLKLTSRLHRDRRWVGPLISVDTGRTIVAVDAVLVCINAFITTIAHANLLDAIVSGHHLPNVHGMARSQRLNLGAFSGTWTTAYRTRVLIPRLDKTIVRE